MTDDAIMAAFNTELTRLMGDLETRVRAAAEREGVSTDEIVYRWLLQGLRASEAKHARKLDLHPHTHFVSQLTLY